MFFSLKKILEFMRIIFLSFLLSACLTPSYQNRMNLSLLQTVAENGGPKTVAVMPFINETAEPDLEILVRRSFYNHFSSKSYRDLELDHIDHGLEIITKKNKVSSWKDLSVNEIGNHLHADLIIYGRVKEYKKIFLGIYSQIALRLAVEIMSSEREDIVWKKDITERSHDGGLPFNPFGIIPAALRSGLHMKEEKTVELVNRLNSKLAAQIPEPAGSKATPYFIDLQVASFLENESAGKVMRLLEAEGLNPRTEVVILDNRQWHRVLTGPYYNLSEAERIREQISRDTEFKPIFIHHYPEVSEKNDRPYANY